MPVTKTAKRALRGSKVKKAVNDSILQKLEVAIRVAKKSLKLGDISKAFSLADRAAKKKTIHKNKAGRIKSRLGKLTSTKSSKVASKK